MSMVECCDRNSVAALTITVGLALTESYTIKTPAVIFSMYSSSLNNPFTPKLKNYSPNLKEKCILCEVVRIGSIITWPSPKAGQVLKCRRFIIIIIIIYFFFGGGGGGEGVEMVIGWIC